MMCEAEYIDNSEPVRTASDIYMLYEKVLASDVDWTTRTYTTIPFEEALRQFLALVPVERQHATARSGAQKVALNRPRSPNQATR